MEKNGKVKTEELPHDFPIATNGVSDILPQQQFPQVEQLEKLVESIMATQNMNLRSNISSQLLPHLVRMAVFAEQYNSPMMLKVMASVLQLSTSVRGWQMGNLIKAISSLRQASVMDDNTPQRGMVRRLVGR